MEAATVPAGPEEAQEALEGVAPAPASPAVAAAPEAARQPLTSYTILSAVAPLADDEETEWIVEGTQDAHGPSGALRAFYTDHEANFDRLYRAVSTRSWGEPMRLRPQPPIAVITES